MRIAFLGTRGVPAHYGGFETAAEEIGSRLVDQGHEVIVYCRWAEKRLQEHKGMRLVHLPALRLKHFETLSHTALSVVDVSRRNADLALVFNSANSVFIPALHRTGLGVVTHVDGLEWRRDKWQGLGRRYYKSAEALAVRWSDALIADALGIQDYYREEFGARSHYLPYGAPVLERPRVDRLQELGLTAKGYHLVVARFEPENHVDMIVDGYLRSQAKKPLVVVGSAPYSSAYSSRIRALADGDDRIRLLGGVWDQELLDALYAGAVTYLHGHSVGGTNPSLLRAMGAGTAISAFDVCFNREVLAGSGRFFSSPQGVAELLGTDEHDPLTQERGTGNRDEALERYTWEAVAQGYEELCQAVLNGYSQVGHYTGRRGRQRSSGASADLRTFRGAPPTVQSAGNAAQPSPSDDVPWTRSGDAAAHCSSRRS